MIFPSRCTRQGNIMKIKVFESILLHRVLSAKRPSSGSPYVGKLCRFWKLWNIIVLPKNEQHWYCYFEFTQLFEELDCMSRNVTGDLAVLPNSCQISHRLMELSSGGDEIIKSLWHARYLINHTWPTVYCGLVKPILVLERRWDYWCNHLSVPLYEFVLC